MGRWYVVIAISSPSLVTHNTTTDYDHYNCNTTVVNNKHEKGYS